MTDERRTATPLPIDAAAASGPRTRAARRPPGLLYAVDEHPPPLRWVLLGFQYAVLNAIYLIIVVIIVQHANVDTQTATDVVSMALVASAIGTTLQSLHRGPVGSGFLAPPVYSAIYLAPSVLAAERGGLPLVFGMTMFAGATELVLGTLVRRLRIVLQPVVSGLTVLIIGLQLGLAGIAEILGSYTLSNQQVELHIAVTLITLGTAVAASIWGRGVLKLMCTLLGLIAGIGASFATGLIGTDAIRTIATHPGFQIPDISYIGYQFDASLVPAFLAAGIAATVRTVGVVTTCQRLNDADWSHPDMNNIRKGIFADGLGCLFSGAIGSAGMNIGPSLVSISSLTGATSRVIAPASAVLLLGFAFLPRIAAGFLALPHEVAGALLIFTATLMISSGMQVILSRTLDTRGLFIVGLSILAGLTRRVFPDEYARLPPALQNLATNQLAVGLITALGLTLLFRAGTKRRALFPGGCRLEARDPVAAFIRKTGADWAVRKTVADDTADTIEALLAHMHVGCLCTNPVRIALSYDGLDFEVKLRYDGQAIAQAMLHIGAPTISDEPLGDEEAAVMRGLTDFLRNSPADESRVRSRKGLIEVRLRFAT